MLVRADGQPIPPLNQHAVDTMGEIASVIEDVSDGTVQCTNQDLLLASLRIAHDMIRDNVAGANGRMIERG